MQPFRKALRKTWFPKCFRRFWKRGMSMSAFAEWLTPLIDRPIVDATDLKGSYKMTMELPTEVIRNAIIMKASTSALASSGTNPFRGYVGPRYGWARRECVGSLRQSSPSYFTSTLSATLLGEARYGMRRTGTNTTPGLNLGGREGDEARAGVPNVKGYPILPQLGISPNGPFGFGTYGGQLSIHAVHIGHGFVCFLPYMN